MDLIITILPVVTKDLPISPRFTPYDFLSRCKFSTLTTRQPMVERSDQYPFYSLKITEYYIKFRNAVLNSVSDHSIMRTKIQVKTNLRELSAGTYGQIEIVGPIIRIFDREYLVRPSETGGSNTKWWHFSTTHFRPEGAKCGTMHNV